MIVALIILAFAALIGVPVWILLVGYKDGMAKIARERELVDQLIIFKVQDQVRQRDMEIAAK